MRKYKVGVANREDLLTELWANDSMDAKTRYLIWVGSEAKRHKEYWKLLGKKKEYVCEVIK